MNRLYKAIIEIIETIEVFLITIIGLPLIIYLLNIVSSDDDIGIALGAICFIMANILINPISAIKTELYKAIYENEGNILLIVILSCVIMTLIEAWIYTLLYKKHKNKYLLISLKEEDGKITSSTIYIRGILKSLNRQFYMIALIPLVIGFERTLYDIILKTDMTKNKKNKTK